MRVVHAIRSGNFAGVERHVLSLAITQRQRGDEVTVIGGDASRMQAPLAEAGARFTPATTTFDVVHALARLRSWGPDVINAHMTAAETAAVITGLAPGAAPIVATRHFATHRGSRPALRPILRLGTRRLAAQIAVSDFVAAHIDGPSTVVHSGVPVRPHSDVPRERTVLVVQRLEPEKLTDLTLSAFSRSGLAAEGWRLELVGDGALRNDLQDNAVRLGIAGATTFLGHRSDVPDRMDAASILVAPTASEALGLTVLEAMAGGLPVVASASGGHLETVGSASDAAMFPAGDVDAAARLLRELAADDTRRVAYGADLRAIQRERFTIEAQAEATDAVYRSVL
ncbi:glycosyltransferase involved in cell wall biosynthesis [Yimella lutea]|uniref:D-inositol 3-phosphate glycosyltransferase n=1 Tax=Yimella lutea TaxID=587872 RepID=A0A542EJU8_9MICO|nr:glycosyltransferase family 4 protein [Yimella lutea]TQJ15620.1 glycosyltransferase involved in cell wall biosynthesis [Yimella lutea]